jgi:serine/threonine protein phosphatase PrpC
MSISTSPPHPWTSVGITHTGNIRDHNEDAFLELPEQRLWIAADGMGGHTAGDFASRLIIDQFKSFKASSLTGHSVDQIRQTLAKVNLELWVKAQQMGDIIIGSTVAILLATDHHVASVWSGDSRIYRLRDGLFKQITRDHSAEEEIEFGIDDFEGSALNNAVTQAIGATEELQVEIEIRENRPGDTYLLCSDGLNKELSDQRMAAILLANNVQSAGQILLHEALDNYGRDNITVVLAHYPMTD